MCLYAFSSRFPSSPSSELILNWTLFLYWKQQKFYLKSLLHWSMFYRSLSFSRPPFLSLAYSFSPSLVFYWCVCCYYCCSVQLQLQFTMFSCSFSIRLSFVWKFNHRFDWFCKTAIIRKFCLCFWLNVYFGTVKSDDFRWRFDWRFWAANSPRITNENRNFWFVFMPSFCAYISFFLLSRLKCFKSRNTESRLHTHTEWVSEEKAKWRRRIQSVQRRLQT